MWHIFRRPEMTIKITTITTHFTTHLPSKNHVLHPVFCKTPCKNALLPQIKNIYKTIQSERQIILWWGLTRLVWLAAQNTAALPRRLPGRLTPQPPTPEQCEQDSGAAPSSHEPGPDYASE
jgi:hypothetical protein